MFNKQLLRTLGIAICSVSLTYAMVSLFVYAGNIDSPGSPTSAGRMYTLEQIYQKLANGTSATKNTSFNFPSGAPGSTMHTLDDIYNSIPSAGSNVTGGNGLLTFTIPNGIYSGSKTATAGDTNLQATNIKSGTSIFGTTGNYTGTTYTWTKNGTGSWIGINGNLNWAIEIGAANWWNGITYTYCAGATTCTTTSDNATLKASASYVGSPGGWNGSNNQTNFDQSALQTYAVVSANSTNLGNCTADRGDLVFPDGSVWDKDATNAYSTTLTGCGPDSGGSTWTNAGGTGKQYGYVNNAPSALSIADAWDGIKDLTSGINGTHSFTNDGVMNDYYDRLNISWYSAGGTSRIPITSELVQAMKGTFGGDASLLYGTNAWTNSLYLWSAEPYPSSALSALILSPAGGKGNNSTVNSSLSPIWVVVAQ
ncbi:MAG: hypothetical protein NT155_00335 [Candidatus Staskawiczbacteria bacterium]|nr:hypothetical protein [Candidatus Staskawiczbacteria bacterium]